MDEEEDELDELEEFFRSESPPSGEIHGEYNRPEIESTLQKKIIEILYNQEDFWLTSSEIHAELKHGGNY